MAAEPELAWEALTSSRPGRAGTRTWTVFRWVARFRGNDVSLEARGRDDDHLDDP